MHKLFSNSIFCNSYLDLASSYKWKELITQMELITDMDQHHNLFRKRNKKIVGNGQKCLYINLKMQIWAAEIYRIRRRMLNSWICQPFVIWFTLIQPV